jgi:ABC-type polysaccharide/polyol phosphate transport system ATPase subunit
MCSRGVNDMANNLAIKTINLTKCYQLYDKPTDRLKEAVHPWGKKYHHDFFALNDINIEIEKGDIVGIIGKNGSGKSTLLKILTGVLTQTSGDTEVNGKISALLELGAGFNPEMNGIENIYFNGTLIGLTKEQIDLKVDSIIEFADIGDFIHQPVKTYSSGMFVRLAFAVAVNVEPDILIVDEALAVGDLPFQTKCITYMKKLFNMGTTVLLVTHDLSSVKGMCNKALYLENGNMVAYGPAPEIVDLYAKKCRDEMTLQNLSFDNTESMRKVKDISKLNSDSPSKFREDPEFAQKVAPFRQGTGQAKVVNVQVLDGNEEEIELVDFNQQVSLRIHIQFYDNCILCIGYHIRDNKNIEILGSNSIIEDIGEVKGCKGQDLVVDFETCIPLMEGNYNVTVVLSKETVPNRAATFIDCVENTAVFRVAERKDCRIWNKVYIANKIKFYS